jgi:outer membrane protein assembly factor BamB
MQRYLGTAILLVSARIGYAECPSLHIFTDIGAPLTATRMTDALPQAEGGGIATLVAKLKSEDNGFGDQFGYGVALDSTYAVVGATRDDDLGNNAGAVWVFDAATGGFVDKLFAEGGGSFGSAVGVSDGRIIVGAPFFDGIAGAAYIFDVATGAKLAMLQHPEPNDQDYFGQGVAINESVALVGAYGDDDNNSWSGSALLFHADTGEMITKIVPDDGLEGDNFGYSVALSDTMALIGAPRERLSAGAAYIYDLATHEFIAKLKADDWAHNDRFGHSVAISESYALVGSRWDDDDGSSSGSAYVFDSQTGRQLRKLVAPDAWPKDIFGISVSIAGNIALIGAYLDDDNGLESGSAYLFDVETGEMLAKFVAHDGAENDEYGLPVAVTDTGGLIGARWNDENGNDSGAAYLYAITQACPADMNRDAKLDILDFVAFQLAWTAQDPVGDCDDNAAFNILDFVCFQQLFQAGCK